VEHLVAQAAGRGGESQLIGEADKEDKQTGLPQLAVRTYLVVDDENPTDLLARLLELYWLGLGSPLRFFPKSSMKYAEKMVQKPGGASGRGQRPGTGADEAKALQAALTAWIGDPNYSPGEKDDPCFELCFRGFDDPIDSEFSRIALDILGPMLRHEPKAANLP